MAGKARRFLASAAPVAAAYAGAWVAADRAARTELGRVDVPPVQPGLEQELGVPVWQQLGPAILSWAPERLATFTEASAAFEQVKLAWVAVQSAMNATLGTIDQSVAGVNERVAVLRARASSETGGVPSAVTAELELRSVLLGDGSQSPMLAGWSDTSVWWDRLGETPAYLCHAGEFGDGASCLVEFPTRSISGMYRDSGHRATAVRWAQGLVLRVLAAFPPQTWRLWVFDPNLGEAALPFTALHACNAGPRYPYWGSVLVDRSDVGDIRAAVEALEQQATETGTTYLGAQHATIWDYLDKDPEGGFQGDLVLAVDWDRYPGDTAARLQRLAVTGPDRGVTVIGLAAEKVIDETHKVAFDQPDRGRFQPYSAKAAIPDVRFDMPPPDFVATISKMLADRIGPYKPPGLPLMRLLPPPDQWWQHTRTPGETGVPVGDATSGLAAPIGVAGNSTLHVQLSDQPVHGLFLGTSGSGKTTALHAFIHSLAACYSPDELRLYLIDMKEGVEFQLYAPSEHNPGLPHVRVVASSADRELALAVLERMAGIIDQRAAMYKQVQPNVTNYVAYRTQESDPLPRIVTIIDEYQSLFTPSDDSVAQQAWQALNLVARKGRAYGVHLLMGTQTLSGVQGTTASFRKGIYDQMTARLQLAEKGSGEYKIIDPDSDGALFRSRVQIANPGTADDLRVFQRTLEEHTSRIVLGSRTEPPIVFSGDETPSATDQPPIPDLSSGLVLCVGQPCAVTNQPAKVRLHADRGRNVAMFGAGGLDDNSGVGALSGMTLSFLTNEPAGHVTLINLLPVGSVFESVPDDLAAAAPRRVNVTRGDSPSSSREAALNELARLAATTADNPTLVVGFGLHYLNLAQRPDKEIVGQLTAMFRDGPSHHLWTVGWWDSLRSFTTAFGKESLDWFPTRIVLSNAGTEGRDITGIPMKELRPARGILWEQDDRTNPTTFIPYSPPTAGQVREWASHHRVPR